MTRDEAVNIVLKHLEDAPVPTADKRPFLVRLLCSIRMKLGWKKDKPEITITGNADF
jgi:hypothetical protein